MRELGYCFLVVVVLFIVSDTIKALAASKRDCRPDSSDKVGITYSNGECHVVPKRLLAR